MSVLVTGGAGYVGSHVVRLLAERGEDVVVVDDLSTGRRANLPETPLLELDLSGPQAVEALTPFMKEHRVDAAFHFAAQKEVGVSMRRPTHYMRQNVGGMANLLDALEAAGVRRLIYSSSAAVYGTPKSDEVREDNLCFPINTYGETKLIGEWLCHRAVGAWGLTAASLRYFNVAGAGWPDLGDPVSLNLVPIVFDRLVAGDPPRVFGNDYATPDGSCIRDYVHVLDLAEAHIVALDQLHSGHEVFNIGTGRGSSVFEIIEEIGRVTGLDATPEVVGRRKGDPPRLVASVDKAAAELGWRSSRGLSEIIASAWEAHQQR